MDNADLSEDGFQKLKAVISQWFDQHRYVSRLKVLYKGFLSSADLHKSTKTIELLNYLTALGELNSTNLTLFYDTINVTKTFGLVETITRKMPSCPIDKNVKDIKISKFTPHRLKLMKLGSLLGDGDVAKIDGLYNSPALKNYADSWTLIMDLEKECKIKEGEMDEFVNNLKILELQAAVDALCEGNSNTSSKSGQESFADSVIKDFLTKRQKELYKDVNKMTPTIFHKHHKVDIAEVFTEVILMQSQKEAKESQFEPMSIKKEGTSTSLQDVLSLIETKSTKSCKVLITGKGGMGKTTLLRYIAHQWATDGAYNAFANKLLFLINIRDIEASKNFMDIIKGKIDWEALILKNKLPSDSVETFLITHADEIVLLLDGYDELKKDAKDPLDLFEKNKLGESTVLISSRPDNVDKLVRCCDVHVEVKGFSPRSIKSYISKHFCSIGKKEVGCSLINEFGLQYIEDNNTYEENVKDSDSDADAATVDEDEVDADDDYVDEYGGEHKEAFELCSSPLLLLKICTIWENKHSLPTNVTDLFKELFCCILNQYENRDGNRNCIAKFERIPKHYREAILLLGECMYEGLKENRLFIDRFDLSMKAKEKEDVVELALKIGFVYEDIPVNPDDVREIETPPHKLISESLAGYYLSEQIQKDKLKADEYEVIRSNEYLHMTRVFTIGFLGGNAGKLLKHWLVNRAQNYSSIAQCFIHVKKEYEEHVLQTLDKDMPNEMKACCELMCELISNFKTHSINGHLFQLMKIFATKYQDYAEEIAGEAISLINTSSEESLRKSCKNFLLISVVVQTLQTKKFVRKISNWRSEDIDILSAEMKRLDFTYDSDYICLDFQFNSSFLIHILKNARELSTLNLSDSHMTSTVFSVVVNELHNSCVQLKLRYIDISDNNLSLISGRTLACLYKLSHDLIRIDMRCCSLSGSTINEMMEECGQMNVEMKPVMFDLYGNDLSAINGQSLAKLVKYETLDGFFSSSHYSLEAHNLEMLVESISKNETLNWKWVDWEEVNLSSISGRTLACLLNLSPDLTCLNMRGCNLSASTINEMMEECGKMNVVLKDKMLSLRENDLSAINGKLLAKLVRYEHHFEFIWSEYSLTAHNLEKLVESMGQNETFNWKYVDLSGIDLSSISGRTLACLLKFSPDLICLVIEHCNLSGSTINEMMEECDKMNLVLKDILSLKENDLSAINNKSLPKLVRYERYNFVWTSYCLAAHNLATLVESIGKDETLNWKYVDLSRINLSLISGKTLACLLKSSPDLKHIDMSHCNLSGSTINKMMEECGKMNVELKDEMLCLKGNDISAINGKSLSKIVRCAKSYEFVWRSYFLAAHNLEMLVESKDKNEALNWKWIDLSEINLSLISGRVLASLLKFSPGLTYIGMKHCSLKGSIVNEMMEECCKMNVVFKDKMLELRGNDLSAINGKSLAIIVRYEYHFEFVGKSYSLAAHNLEKLVESIGPNETLNWDLVDLSGINLSSISGKTLASLLKFSPDLIRIDMNHCSLSSSIINEMMEECGEMNVVLKDNILRLK